MNILMLSSRIPYPLTAGFRIRIFNEAKYFKSDGNNVDCLYLGDRSEYRKYKNNLTQIFRKVYCIPFSKIEAVKQLFKCIGNKDLPFQVQLYQNDVFREKLLEIEKNYDVVIGNHIRTSEYLKLLNKQKVVLDLHDAISYNYKNAIKVAIGLKKTLYSIEYRRVLKYECDICSFFPKVVIISETDKKWLGDHGADVSEVTVIPVAVRDDINDRKQDYTIDKHIICFLGKMSYQPNIDAATWFSKKVFPKLRELDNKLAFYIIGIEPTDEIIKLQSDPNIHVTGFMEDPFSLVAESMAMVVPIRNGAGIQNKVLESMVVGTPVVASPIAAQGIKAEDGKQLLIAHSEGEFVSKIWRLIQSDQLRRKIGLEGQTYVNENYTWEALWKRWRCLIQKGGKMP